MKLIKDLGAQDKMQKSVENQIFEWMCHQVTYIEQFITNATASLLALQLGKYRYYVCS
jgi:hypothetical protein